MNWAAHFNSVSQSRSATAAFGAPASTVSVTTSPTPKPPPPEWFPWLVGGVSLAAACAGAYWLGQEAEYARHARHHEARQLAAWQRGARFRAAQGAVKRWVALRDEEEAERRESGSRLKRAPPSALTVRERMVAS